jgi:hypothetical protein
VHVPGSATSRVIHEFGIPAPKKGLHFLVLFCSLVIASAYGLEDLMADCRGLRLIGLFKLDV